MTPELHAWATRHHLSHQALHELRIVMGLQQEDRVTPRPCAGMSEEGVASRMRLAAADAGLLVWRNNVGAMQDASGRVVRYGIANDTAAMNRRIKSSDWVGIKPNGQFWCRETKHGDWMYTGTDREEAQLRFIQLVLSQGGDAAFSIGGF